MSDNQNTNQDDLTDDKDLDNKDTDKGDDDRTASLSDEHRQLLEALVQDQLKGFKEKVDRAYKERDEALQEAARAKANQKETERKKLTEEGKHLEVAQLRITELEEDLRVRSERLTAVERDRALDAALQDLPFRNDFARDTAFQTIIKDLVYDEDDGAWVHKTGASLKDYAKAFSKDPTKDFFFQAKTNSGTGTGNDKTTSGNKGRPPSLEGLSTAELLKLAKDGKLSSFSY